LKKVEQDLITLGLIGIMMSQSGKKLEQLIPNYQKDKVIKINNKFFKNEDYFNKQIEQLANECYNRIKRNSSSVR
jgi:hypothetical protein